MARRRFQLGIAEHQFTHLGNARRFLGEVEGEVHWVPTSVTRPDGFWRVFDGRVWVADRGKSLETRVAQFLDRWLRQVEEIEDLETQAAYRQWVLQSQSVSNMDAILKAARTEPGVTVLPEEFDSDRNRLAVENGTLDLDRGLLLPHHPEHLITRLLPVTYDPAARCPAWERHLRRFFPDQGLIEYLARVFGYILRGQNTEQVFFVLWGASGANGKGTTVHTLQHLFGAEWMDTPMSTFTVSKMDRPIRGDLARLRSARLVTSSEVGKGRRTVFDSEMLKRVTGGDPITERDIYEKHSSYTAGYSVVFMLNDKPKIRATDQAMWRRPQLIPCSVQLPRAEWDLQIEPKLRAEASGILNWLLAGYADYLRGGLQAPAVVRQATDAYRVEQDPLYGFDCECAEFAPEHRVIPDRLHDRWEQYKREHQINKKLLGTAASFSRAFGERHPELRHIKAGGIRYLMGVRLREEGDSRPDDFWGNGGYR